MKSVKLRLLQLIFGLLNLTATSPALGFDAIWSPTKGATFVSLIQDPEFKQGLRAYMSCEKFEGDLGNTEGIPAGLMLGNCVQYKKTSGGITLRALPEGGAPQDSGKSWNLNEGLHLDSLNQDYFFYRMEAFSDVVANNSDLYWLQQSRPGTTGAEGLIRTFQSNRKGAVFMYENTQNDFFNNATDNSPAFGADTWPHYYVEQNFKQFIDLGMFRNLNFRAYVRLPGPLELPGWSEAHPGHTYTNATFSMTTLLRHKTNPFLSMFLVLSPYSSNGLGYKEEMSVDQHGQLLYRADALDPATGGLLSKSGTGKFIQYDIVEYVRRASRLKPVVGAPEDWYVASVVLGWEAVGFHILSSELSSVSLTGEISSLLHPLVFDLDAYRNRNPDLKSMPANLLRSHWLRYGAQEGRVASTQFSAAKYLSNYPDVRAAYGAQNYRGAIEHYILFGRFEGRVGR